MLIWGLYLVGRTHALEIVDMGLSYPSSHVVSEALLGVGPPKNNKIKNLEC